MTPDSISYEHLLSLLDENEPTSPNGANAVYLMQLRHDLLSLSRKVRLQRTALELSGMDESEIAHKTLPELLRLIETHRGAADDSLINKIRYWK